MRRILQRCTIVCRKGCFDEIVYVVDKRQQLHMRQVFCAAHQAGIVTDDIALTHVAFGTMNGSDNKPFKTRAGGTMKLKDLLVLTKEQAHARLVEAGHLQEASVDEQQQVARLVGLATLKFADLSNYHENDYVFDFERFSLFEGYTGPYLLYNTVRAKSILAKVSDAGVESGTIQAPQRDSERALLLRLAEFSNAMEDAWRKKSPSELCEYAYVLANEFSTFYHDCPVLKEPDVSRQRSHVRLVQLVSNVLTQSLDLLGIQVPKRM